MCVFSSVHRALYYQRRWVKLDADYLRYFDNEKVPAHMYQLHHISLTLKHEHTLSACCMLRYLTESHCLFQEVYSKGIISTAFITSVASVGELKFEVVTDNRTFIFRAETEGLFVVCSPCLWLHIYKNTTCKCLKYAYYPCRMQIPM